MSIDKMKTGAKASAQVAMREKADGCHKLGGVFHVECYDKDGKLKWVEDAHNKVTTENQDNILDVYYNESTQILTWYIVLSESDTAPALTMTYAIKGFTETTSYSTPASTRQIWQADAASGNSMTNSTSADHVMSATKTIYGCGLVGGGATAANKGDTTSSGAVLACYAEFTDGERSVKNLDELLVTYTLTAADDEE